MSVEPHFSGSLTATCDMVFHSKQNVGVARYNNCLIVAIGHKSITAMDSKELDCSRLPSTIIHIMTIQLL